MNYNYVIDVDFVYCTRLTYKPNKFLFESFIRFGGSHKSQTQTSSNLRSNLLTLVGRLHKHKDINTNNKRITNSIARKESPLHQP